MEDQIVSLHSYTPSHHDLDIHEERDTELISEGPEKDLPVEPLDGAKPNKIEQKDILKINGPKFLPERESKEHNYRKATPCFSCIGYL
jgi:hypothetical protein